MHAFEMKAGMSRVCLEEPIRGFCLIRISAGSDVKSFQNAGVVFDFTTCRDQGGS